MSALALALSLSTGALPAAAQDLLVTGNCPLGDNTFAVGDTLTFTEASEQLANILAPAPSYRPCEPVTFAAHDVTGKPPVTKTWTLDGRVQYPGTSVTLDTATLAAGSHTMTFRASNAHGTATRSVAFSVQALAFALPPTYENLGASTAHFEANTSGATEWRWEWGDGTATAWLASCPGYAPTHAYPRPGTYMVRVQARNCRDAPIATTLTVTITANLAPRVLTFLAACPLGFCIFPAGTPVLFGQTFAGTPTTYRYDWDGNGTFEQVSTTPVTTHTYLAAGLFIPVLQVADATTSHTLAHQGGPLLVQGTSPAPVPTTPTGLVLEIVGHEFAPVPPPNPPTDVWTIAALLVRLRWTDHSADEAGFNVYRSTADGPYQLVNTVPANSTATANLRLAAGALYRFRMTAFSAAGESQPTSPASLDLRP